MLFTRIDRAEQLPVTTGLVGVPPGMVTSSALVGTRPPLQLPAVLQLVLTAPVQVKVGGAWGQPITAPPLTWVKLPGVAGEAPTRFTVRAFGVGPSVSLALR